MPTYDYKCSACGHELEKFQPMSAAALKKCPKCGKSALKRLIGTGAGVIFKGGGFYQTDYRSDSYQAAAKKDSGEGASEKSADKSADTTSQKTSEKGKPGGETRGAESSSAGESRASSGSKQRKKPSKGDS